MTPVCSQPPILLSLLALLLAPPPAPAYIMSRGVRTVSDLLGERGEGTDDSGDAGVVVRDMDLLSLDGFIKHLKQVKKRSAEGLTNGKF